MLAITAPARLRRHRPLDQRDRRALERAGWRTLLDYRENHVRDVDGTLLQVVPRWTAEAERIERRGGEVRTLVASVTACSRAEAWALLRRAAAQARRDAVSRRPDR